MANVIWKYQIGYSKREEIDIPENAEILCVKKLEGRPCIWALVNDKNPIVKRTFSTYPTGWEIKNIDGLWYIGTIITDGGTFEAHIFEILE